MQSKAGRYRQQVRNKHAMQAELMWGVLLKERGRKKAKGGGNRPLGTGAVEEKKEAERKTESWRGGGQTNTERDKGMPA